MASSDRNPTPRVRTDDVLTLLRRIQGRLLVFSAVVLVLGVGLGFLIDGSRGAIGALIAAVLGFAFTVTTIAGLRLVAGRAMELLQLVLIGGWLVKMVLVVIVMLWLRTQDFFNREVFFGTLVVVVVGAVIVEIHAAIGARIPHGSDPAASAFSGTAAHVSDLTPGAATGTEDHSEPRSSADRASGGPAPQESDPGRASNGP